MFYGEIKEKGGNLPRVVVAVRREKEEGGKGEWRHWREGRMKELKQRRAIKRRRKGLGV